MAKKKKKNKGKKKVSSPKQQDAAVLLREQQEVLSAMRGRRASVLGERIFLDESVDESVRRRAFAAGHEAYLRELLAKGHESQARAKAEKLLKTDAWMSDFWALSLQVRLGLAVDLTEQSVLDRLRTELVDPSDLCGVVEGDLGVQAQAVLDAWSRVEASDCAGALEGLKVVGRRSPLVDWRLFVQGLVSIQQQDRTGADLAVKRMQRGCPAQRAAERLLVRVDEGVGFYGRRLKALEQEVDRGRLKPNAYPKLRGVVKRALAEGRPGLALAMTTTFAMTIESEFDADRYYSMFDREAADGFSLTHIYIRSAIVEHPEKALLHPQFSEDLRSSVWSKVEAARLWIRFFEQVRGRWAELQSDLDEWMLEDAVENLLEPLLADCRLLVPKLQDCRELYEFWIWAEKECKVGTHHGINAYLKAFPADPEVLALAVRRFAEEKDFKAAERWLGRLGKLKEAELLVESLRPVIQFHRIRNAFQLEDQAQVESLASVYSGQNVLETVQVAFMRWHLASKGERRKRGVELAALNVPWLVLFYGGIHCVSKLPAAVTRSLKNDPDAVLRGFLEQLAFDASAVAEIGEYDVLCSTLGAALDHPDVSIDLLRPVFGGLIRYLDDGFYFVDTTDGCMGATRRLLKDSADQQALALIVRLWAIAAGLDESLDLDKAERSLRVAWTLSEQAETRQLISRVVSKLPGRPASSWKKPATEKMIKAELKMQGKFCDLGQAEARYTRAWHEPKKTLNPFYGLNEAEIEKVLERMGRGSSCNKGSFDEDDDAVDFFEPEMCPASRPYIFSKFVPTMEMEFESIIQNIQGTTRGPHRVEAAKKIGGMIEASSLSDKAKARLWKKQRELLGGE